MSVGEIAFLALVSGSFVVFGIAMIWLRLDYVRFRDRAAGQGGLNYLQAQMAE